MKQNKAKVIRLTGGIATGKSTVSNILKNKGFKIIDADKIARDIVNVGNPAYEDIVNYFGRDILNKDKTINRESLGEKIFNDEKLRAKLNSITHPYIIEKIKSEIKLYSNEEIVVLDVPLLIEVLDSFKERDININKIWIVYCDEKTQIKRLMDRNKLGHESALKRIKSQLSIEEKLKFADTIIDNTKDVDTLVKNIDKALEEML